MRIAARFSVFAVLLVVFIALPGAGRVDTQPQTARSPFDALHFRDIGPEATGGRMHDLQTDPSDPAVLCVGAATGGIWKSTNQGVTCRDIFGKQPENTFGSLAIFARDPKIIWAGTGENNHGGPGTQRAGVVQLPIASHDIGPRGPHVAPGTFKVTLEVDGVASGSKTFAVRADSASAVTLTQHKAREAFVVDVMELQARVDRLPADLRPRTAAATGDAAAKLQALTLRLGGARGGGRGGGRGGPQPLRQRLGGLTNPYLGSGARTGTLAPPTGAMIRKRFSR